MVQPVVWVHPEVGWASAGDEKVINSGSERRQPTVPTATVETYLLPAYCSPDIITKAQERKYHKVFGFRLFNDLCELIFFYRRSNWVTDWTTACSVHNWNCCVLAWILCKISWGKDFFVPLNEKICMKLRYFESNVF